MSQQTPQTNEETASTPNGPPGVRHNQSLDRASEVSEEVAIPTFTPVGSPAQGPFDGEGKAQTDKAPSNGKAKNSNASRSGPSEPKQNNANEHKTKPKSFHNIPLSEQKTRGVVPNVVRCAVPLEDLREHPCFHELPHPSEVRIQCFQHLSLYRKDSWQYTNLIKGRLNCNQLASILGFYETKYASLLKIPEGRIGHHHAIEVWNALKEKPISDFQQLQNNAAHLTPVQLQRIARNQRFRRQNTKWKRTTKSIFMFEYEPHKFAAFKQYRDLTSGRLHNANLPTIQWQRAHDPVGLLAAVNMFGKLGAKIKEVGMLPLDAVGIPPHFNVHQNKLEIPLMSASPHAIIEWYNGTIEVLMVVSKCPFERVQPRPNEKQGEFRVIDRKPESVIPPWMYPQIQFQIYCAGIKTTSAIVIFYTPTGGMNLFRVPKCQVYIDHMLTFVHLYHKQFASAPPQENFFLKLQGYEQFLHWTHELATKVPLLTHIPPEMVQCSPLDNPSNTSWFLENVQNPYLTGNHSNQRKGQASQNSNRGPFNNRGGKKAKKQSKGQQQTQSGEEAGQQSYTILQRVQSYLTNSISLDPAME